MDFKSSVLITMSFCMMFIAGFLMWSVFIDGEIYRPPVIYWEGCFTPTQEVFHPGDPLTLRVIATKQRALPGFVTWSLVNSKTLEVASSFVARSTVIGVGYNDSTVQVFLIPEKTPPGVYFARGMATYPINSLKDITYSLQSGKFRIESGDS
jgi:hypothetical protein